MAALGRNQPISTGGLISIYRREGSRRPAYAPCAEEFFCFADVRMDAAGSQDFGVCCRWSRAHGPNIKRKTCASLSASASSVSLAHKLAIVAARWLSSESVFTSLLFNVAVPEYFLAILLPGHFASVGS